MTGGLTGVCSCILRTTASGSVEHHGRKEVSEAELLREGPGRGRRGRQRETESGKERGGEGGEEEKRENTGVQYPL